MRTALALAFFVLSACFEHPVVCPDIAIPPHAEVSLTPGLGAGVWNLAVDSDGTHEDCTLTVGPVGPAVPMGGMVRGPTTRDTTTCKSLVPSGVSDDGTISAFSTPGTPAALSVTITMGAMPRASGTFQLAYPPDECGFQVARGTLTPS